MYAVPHNEARMPHCGRDILSLPSLSLYILSLPSQEDVTSQETLLLYPRVITHFGAPTLYLSFSSLYFSLCASVSIFDMHIIDMHVYK